MPTSQFTVYKYTDTSAPTVNGTVGSIITLLDACLVNGYGSQLPPSPAWTKPFANASNVGCWKQGAGAGLYLSINDNAPGAGGAKEARMTGYETLSAVATGTGPFPTAAQGVGGVAMMVIRKSNTADAVTRPWIVFADAYTFYAFIQTNDASAQYFSFSFGDIYALKGSSDLWRCFLQAKRFAENDATLTTETLDVVTASLSSTNNQFLARAYTAVPGSALCGKHGDSAKAASSAALGGILQSPNGADNAFYISPVWVHETAGVIRGRMRGFYNLLHNHQGFYDWQILQGAGDYAGKTFMLIKVSGNSTLFCIEISATVETN